MSNNPDSFPVLKAFQEYLEAERQRARTRTIWLAAFFMFVLVVIVGGMLTAGIIAFNHYADNVDRVQDALVKTLLSQAGDPGSAADGPSAPPVHDPSPDETMAEMVRAFNLMQETNRMLRGEIMAFQAQFPLLASNLVRQVTEERIRERTLSREEDGEPSSVTGTTGEKGPEDETMAAVEEGETERSALTAPQERPGPTPVPDGFREVSVYLESPRETGSLPWKLLIPE